MPGKIPDRWEAYKALGKVIKGTRFISFKVPLESGITQSLPVDEQFSPDKLVEEISNMGYTLGQVIDLTNTKRYYRPMDLEQHGVKYAKIFTEGHVVPSLKVRRRFYSAVDRFMQNADTPDSLVGVHCTHGLNRTGYLICRYMIDKMDFDPEAAIQAFNEARGYNIERENYLEDLRTGKSQNLEDVEMDDEADDQSAYRDEQKRMKHRYNRQNSGSSHNQYKDHRNRWTQGGYQSYSRGYRRRDSYPQEHYGYNSYSYHGRSYADSYQQRQYNYNGGYYGRDRDRSSQGQSYQYQNSRQYNPRDNRDSRWTSASDQNEHYPGYY